MGPSFPVVRFGGVGAISSRIWHAALALALALTALSLAPAAGHARVRFGATTQRSLDQPRSLQMIEDGQGRPRAIAISWRAQCPRRTISTGGHLLVKIPPGRRSRRTVAETVSRTQRDRFSSQALTATIKGRRSGRQWRGRLTIVTRSDEPTMAECKTGSVRWRTHEPRGQLYLSGYGDDQITEGAVWAIGTRRGPISLVGSRRRGISLTADTGKEGFSVELRPPRGKRLARGRYRGAVPPNDGPTRRAYLDVSGTNSACGDGSRFVFTVHALRFDRFGDPARVSISFEQRCTLLSRRERVITRGRINWREP